MSSERSHFLSFFVVVFRFTCCSGHAEAEKTCCGSCTANSHLYLDWTWGGTQEERREGPGCGRVRRCVSVCVCAGGVIEDGEGGTKERVFKST